MIYLEKPEKFNPKFEVVSCFVERNNKILLLHRQDYKPEGNTFGVPAGKVDIGEEIEELILQLKEEKSINMSLTEINYFKKVFVKYPDYDFIDHIFHTILEQEPKIMINNKEHKDFVWECPDEALNLPLIQDLDSCIKLFYKR